jgi:hypothetical protein
MKSSLLFAASLLVSSSLAQESNDYYSDAQARISLQLSQDAYCGKAAYLSQHYSGVVSGFVATKVISNVVNDVEGFVGYLPSDKSIFVVFRGSESVRNWITNLSADKTNYTTFPACTGCQVHSGFYSATKSVYPDVLKEVQRLRALYPTYAVKTTGHSLGGALAQLTAMELLNSGYSVSMINFGQPRVGEVNYAKFSQTKMPSQYRVVHNHDIVPHNPSSTWPLNFHHTRYEEWQQSNGVVKQCDASGEDPTCSDSVNALLLNVDDHLVYLGMCMGTSCGTCPAAVFESEEASDAFLF